MELKTLGSGAIDSDVTLAIGCFASIGRSRLADLLVTFGRIAPQVDVCLHEMARSALLPALVAGELDLVIMPPRPLTDLPSAKLWRDWPMVAMAADHPLASRDAVTPGDLTDQTFLISSQTQAGELHRFLADRIGPAVTLTGVLSSTGLPRLLERVAGGRELALVPSTWPVGDRLVTRPIAGVAADFPVQAYWRDRQPQAPLSQLIAALMAEAGAA